MNRKWVKQNAKGYLKRHYWIFLILCLMAGVLGVTYTDALNIVKLPSTIKAVMNPESVEEVQKPEETAVNTVGMSLDAVYDALIEGNVQKANEDSKTFMQEAEESEDKDYGMVQIGRRRGVIAMIVNKVTSGSLYLTIYAGIRSLVGSDNLATIFFIVISLLFVSAVWLFVTGYFKIILKRIFLEGRTYEELPFGRMLFLIRLHKVLCVIKTVALQTIYYFLWELTIVGGFVKRYSYFLVPYIVAENPGISSRKAITLSRKMMNGHKWECFKSELSFLGWEILSAITCGISGLFFSNPYKEAFFSEYYAYLREQAKENQIEDIELLHDKYLFEKASEDVVKQVYNDIPNLQEDGISEEKSYFWLLEFLRNYLGIIFFCDKREEAYRQRAVSEIKYEVYQSVLVCRSYPGRLYPVPEKEKTKKRAESLYYKRHYSVVSLILMFFSFSIIGWLWEVSLHLISDGVFVNRGVLHGPWLPIYGMGGMAILIVLTKLREKPWLEFIGAVLLAGTVEYVTALHLEATHGGQKWWDYSGYFLNINGRVCAEGLLVFGLGGLGVVYFVAPLLDHLFQRLSQKILIPICAVLLLLYVGDQMYSSKNPNMGEGITTVGEVELAIPWMEDVTEC